MGKDCKAINYKTVYTQTRDFIASIRKNRILYLQGLDHTVAQTDSEKSHKEQCQKLTISELNLLDNILTEMDEIEYKARYRGNV